MTAPPVEVSLRITDEFAGPINVKMVFSEEEAIKVTKLGPSVARLYFGHDNGPKLQAALREQLAQPLEA